MCNTPYPIVSLTSIGWDCQLACLGAQLQACSACVGSCLLPSGCFIDHNTID
jgi:hypothetical protein